MTSESVVACCIFWLTLQSLLLLFREQTRLIYISPPYFVTAYHAYRIIDSFKLPELRKFNNDRKSKSTRISSLYVCMAIGEHR